MDANAILTVPTSEGPVIINVYNVMEFHQEPDGVEIKMKGWLPTLPVTVHTTLSLPDFEKQYEQVKSDWT